MVLGIGNRADAVPNVVWKVDDIDMQDVKTLPPELMAYAKREGLDIFHWKDADRWNVKPVPEHDAYQLNEIILSRVIGPDIPPECRFYVGAWHGPLGESERVRYWFTPDS